MWVKICANTNVEDALLAAELGADALGFVFASSVRQVRAVQAAAIVRRLPSMVEKIGVFVSRDTEEIAGASREAGLTGVQLHGPYDAALVRELRARLDTSVSILQTVHWKVDGGANNADEIALHLREIERQSALDRVLVDSKSGRGTGGTGISFDWGAARETLARCRFKVIVAGGLNPANVTRAIEELAPWGVDVASGVEAAPGKKDPHKLRDFIQRAKQRRSPTDEL